MKTILIKILLIGESLLFLLQAQEYKEVLRFDSPAARQAVAVGDHHIYAIDNHHIIKYTLDGDSVGEWKDKVPFSVKHLNSGIVDGDKLYCAHSNYPELPMVSSIEIFDTNTMHHCGNISFGIQYGSCTWIIPGKDCWYVFFAHYENKSQQPGRDVSWSQLVQFDRQWRATQAWVLPSGLVEKVRPYSLSGAVCVDGKFYCTGHDAQECYVLSLPESGSKLHWETTIPVPFFGQGIACDSDKNLWGIDRKKREIIKAQYK